MFPNVDSFLHRPLLENPPMCTLNQLEDGTYSLEDLYMINELLDLKLYLTTKKKG